MPDQTPIYGLRFQELNDPPNGAKLGRELAFDVEDELSRIDTNTNTNTSNISSLDSRVTTNEADIADLKKGWNFIAFGEETSDFTVDLTDGGRFPAGTFRMIRINVALQMVTGNSWVIGRINGLSGASDYNRGWWGESFDGVTTARKVSNTSGNAVFGYTSAQIGSNVETMFYKTHVASEIPIRSISNRGAPSGFDGNREFMHTNNSMNVNTLINSVDYFITSGNIGVAEWYAEGFRV